MFSNDALANDLMANDLQVEGKLPDWVTRCDGKEITITGTVTGLAADGTLSYTIHANWCEEIK